MTELLFILPWILKGSIGLMVFCLGLQVRPNEVTYLFHRPGLLLRSLLSMNIVMPLVAAFLIGVIDLEPAVKFALMALAFSPVPPVLPNKSLKTGGRAAYVFSLLVIVSVLAVLFVPAGVHLFGMAFAKKPLQIPPVAVAQVVLVTILVPLLSGMLIGRIAPALSGRIAKPFSRIATVLLLAALGPLLVIALPLAVSMIGNGTLAAIAVFIVAGYVSGHWLGGPAPEERSVLALFSASRHPGMAFAIANANFPGNKQVAGVVVLYALLNLVISLGYQAWMRRKKSIAVQTGSINQN